MRGNSAVERRTRNQVSPGSNPPLLPFRRLGIFVLSTITQSTQLYKWVPGYRQWWKYEWIVFARNCCVARILPREAKLGRNEQVCHGWGVKHFERSNGLDTALYKTPLYLLSFWGRWREKGNVVIDVPHWFLPSWGLWRGKGTSTGVLSSPLSISRQRRRLSSGGRTESLTWRRQKSRVPPNWRSKSGTLM